ncbi:outer membrane receptor protein involved in Fe transport [Massilia umbonata]|uniref:Outer membrane receptor protein involved in Fe transport n=2 Tax=Pseudoduganella umbonata TaxID=864828 RepID=A0A4P8HMT3_9BURK|nr:outer membrane receptor protein involved in Fe transport [Pseudoduganella umbonata]QCP09744.1 TonB-dependent receptor [Pseudoduganella umbonata]
MKQFRKSALALAVAAMNVTTGAALSASPAHAQTGTGAAEGAADRANAAGGGLERIVVTANRRDQLVQDTPLAVSAFTQDTLQNNQVKDLASLTALVPSLVVEPHSDSGGVHVYMRGVGSANHTELGDPAVAFYVDGIYLPRPQGATALMYDLSHVEVARGPQGTLNGRNSTAGAVNLVSAAPNTTKLLGSASIVVGNHHRIQTQGMINIPFGPNIALRVAAIKDSHDGYVDFARGSNVPPGADRYGAQDQSGARATLLWKILPTLKATFIADYYEDQGAGSIYLPIETQGRDRWSAVIDTPGVLDQSITTYKTKWNWALNDAVDVQYLGSWSRLKRSNASDADAGLYLGFKAENRTEWGQFDSHSNELQFRSAEGGAIEWVAGLFEFGEKNKIRFDIDRSQISEAALQQDLANGNVIFVQPTVGQYASAMTFIQGDRQLKSKAVFAQGSWNLDERYKVTAGARYTKDHKFDRGGQNWACPNWPDNAPRGTTVLTPNQVAPARAPPAR